MTDILQYFTSDWGHIALQHNTSHLFFVLKVPDTTLNLSSKKQPFTLHLDAWGVPSNCVFESVLLKKKKNPQAMYKNTGLSLQLLSI